ncbi:glutathione S-transferase N-terminal domain-containing protein [Falsiroseomonas sp.]|uniref:glutathione S-transferase N-terminal domain-containing protein n=1 Tax=Falsiroseomonas sp. TaxID=2870721 RepID=UPI003F703253
MRSVLYLGSAWSSSWSLVGWMACQLGGIAPEEVRIFLSRPDSPARLKAVSPSGRVPSLHVGGPDAPMVLWDSLAIAEWLWEQDPGCGIWPQDPTARAYARCVAAEVHSHFDEVRNGLPMNLIKRWPVRDGLPSSVKLMNRPGVRAGTERMEAMWRDARARYGGPYIVGTSFCYADAAFAPMCSRYVTYGVELAADSMDFIAAQMESPLMRAWRDRAEAEAKEVGRDIVLQYP